MSALNIRIDMETMAFLERAVRETGRSKSELVREALELWRKRWSSETKRPAELMAGLIGSWDSGGMRLSERTGERFAEFLKERRHGNSAGGRRATRGAH